MTPAPYLYSEPARPRHRFDSNTQRRGFRLTRTLHCLLLPMTAWLSIGAAQGAELLDLRERNVSVELPAGTVSIDDARFLMALALLHADPGKVLAAWAHDSHRVGDVVYASLLEVSPNLDTLPRIGSSAGSFNVETLFAAAPGAAVVSLGGGPTDAQARQIESAGIPVVYVDFFVQPFENQAASLRLLGQLTGASERAERFIAFREQRLKLIADRVAELPADDRPTVFLEAHAGMSADCCNSPGRGNVGDYIEFVGGINIGADVIPGASGKLNLEYVISQDPDVYVATGGPHLEGSGGLVLGPGYDIERAASTLSAVASRQGIAELTAVTNGRVHGLSHLLINSPIDIVAVEVLAKWVHPELFSDLDPAATLDAIRKEFLAVPYRGVHWHSLR